MRGGAVRDVFQLAPLVARVSAAVTHGIGFTGEAALLGWAAMGYAWRRRVDWREVLRQLCVIGWSSLPAVLVTVFFSGAVAALHTADQFVQFGLSQVIGGAVAVSAAREIAPVLGAVIVLARAGAGMTAEIGSMKVTDQLDAMRSLGVSPTEYLVSPRLLAGMVALPLVFVLAVYAGCLGGYVVAQGSGVTLGEFSDSAARLLEFRDLLGGALKSIVFGALIVLVCCAAGLRVTGGAAGVGRQTNTAVVIALMSIYIVNYFLAELIW